MGYMGVGMVNTPKEMMHGEFTWPPLNMCTLPACMGLECMERDIDCP